MAGDLFQQALNLLHPALPEPLLDAALERLHTHLSLVRQWNSLVGLVSEGDVAFLEERHLIDSLSLIPSILRFCGPNGTLLDVGSGGGFPAIPIKCLLPGLRMVLVERSVRKAAFLHRVCATLQLFNTQIIQGSFPEAVPKMDANSITARALDRPRQSLPPLLKRMPLQCTLLCQNNLLPKAVAGLFHVEQVDDAWRRTGLRRGELYLITHARHR
ncbi:MAG TPA: class I SAM-dependent methyltransferase [Candidatus Hydrogenedentes bacterium]|nr:class I SAM-dependent methyltransferase [Candidatus Hydrogenedentota bacterium]